MRMFNINNNNKLPMIKCIFLRKRLIIECMVLHAFIGLLQPKNIIFL